MRTLLEQHSEVWREGGDLASFTATMCINSFNKSTPAYKENFMLKVESLKMDLGWQYASAVERLLISAVVLNFTRWLIVGNGFDIVVSGSHTFAKGTYWGKLLASSNKQYLRSLEALTKFRKLARATPGLRQDLVDEILM